MKEKIQLDVRNIKIGKEKKIILMEAGDGSYLALACKIIQANDEKDLSIDYHLLFELGKNEGHLEIDSIAQTAILIVEKGHLYMNYDYIDFFE